MTITIRIPCVECYRLVIASELTVPRPICADCEKKQA